MRARWAWTLAALAGSLLLTALLWMAGLPGFFLLLFLPFLFGLRGARAAGTGAGAPPPPGCPRCGYVARGPEERFCPRDGAPLA